MMFLIQPLHGESLSLRHICNRDDGARLDIKASGFWGGRFQSFFFLMSKLIFNPRTDQTLVASMIRLHYQRQHMKLPRKRL